MLTKSSTLINNKKVKDVVPTQVKEGNTSENLLNEIRQIIFSLHREKKISKKLRNSIMNSISVKTKWNSKTNEASDPCRLLLNLTDKINTKR